MKIIKFQIITKLKEKNPFCRNKSLHKLLFYSFIFDVVMWVFVKDNFSILFRIIDRRIIDYFKECTEKNLPETLKLSKSKTWRPRKLKLHQHVYLISQTGWRSFSFLGLHSRLGFRAFQSFRRPCFCLYTLYIPTQI